MNKLLALTAAITTSAATAAIAAETTCTAAPSCADLGYTQSSTACSGKYLKCPFDTTKVMCVNGGPRVGDLKYSLYGANHDGWLRCDGSIVKKSDYPKLYDILTTRFCHRYTSRSDRSYTSFSKNNCDTAQGEFALPDYRGFFLRGLSYYNSYTNTVNKPAESSRTPSDYYSDAFYYKGGEANSTIYYPQYETLPDIKGEVAFLGPNYEGSYTKMTPGALLITLSDKKWGDGSGKNTSSAGLSFTASRYSDIYSGTHVIPANYGAYIFIYAGE